MKFITLVIVMLSTLVLMACSPTAPESPDSESYGTTIQPDHNVPAEHQ